MKRNAGASLFWMLLMLVVLAYGVHLGFRITPSVTEYWAVKRLTTKVARMGTEEQARQAFDAEARLLGIQSVRGSDLEILYGSGVNPLRVSFAYDREFALFGPAHLVLRYRGQSF